MTENYHTHTYRCRHSSGTEREYIERAIQNGITHMGFSDHAPFIFPDGYESKYRVPMAQAQEYMDTIRALREEYREKIKISIGFEMEYYPLFFQEMLKIVTDLGAEYLILGQHQIDNGWPIKILSSTETDSEEYLKEYANLTVEGMETGVFSYLAHPDLIYYVGDRNIYAKHMRRICQASNRCGIPLEINFLGIRKKRHYPLEAFWEIVGEEGCEVVFGFDAHDVQAAYDSESLKIAEDMVKRYSLKLNPHPTLIDPRKGRRKEE